MVYMNIYSSFYARAALARRAASAGAKNGAAQVSRGNNLGPCAGRPINRQPVTGCWGSRNAAPSDDHDDRAFNKQACYLTIMTIKSVNISVKSTKIYD